MVTHNPVKLVMKQTLILKNRAAIKICIYTVGQTDMIPPGRVDLGSLCQSMNFMCVLVTG